MANDDSASVEPAQDPAFTPGSAPGDVDVPPLDDSQPSDSDQKPGDQPPKKPEDVLNETRQKAYIEQLEKNYYQSTTRGEKMMSQVQGAMNELMKLANAPRPTPPHGIVSPPPPTEQQKGGLSEFVFNLLKFGALSLIAYGAGGRGYAHNAIYKGAIGAALQGYFSARKDIADSSMKLWEKNREIINDANREQNANYRAVLQDDRLALNQKIDIISNLSKTYGDYRSSQAADNKNLMDLLQVLKDREKLQQEKEKAEIDHRGKAYEVLGEKNVNGQYFDWLYKKSGGKIKFNQNTTPDEWYQVEKDHPEWSFYSFRAWKEKEDIRQAVKKTKALKAAKADEPQEGEESEEEQKKKAAAQKKVDEITAKILPGL